MTPNNLTGPLPAAPVRPAPAPTPAPTAAAPKPAPVEAPKPAPKPVMATDKAQLSQQGEPATEAVELPWDKAADAMSALPDALQAFKDELPKKTMNFFKLNADATQAARELKTRLGYGNTEIRQFFDGSCVAATSQQAWAESDPAGYGDAAKGLTGESHELHLPHPPGGVNPVTALTADEVAYLDAQAEAQGLSEAETRDFYMQYGLMKFAAEAGPNPQVTEPGAIEDGSQDAGLPAEAGRETNGLDWFQAGWMNDAIFGAEGGPAINRGQLHQEAGITSLGEADADPAAIAEAERLAAAQLEAKAGARPGALLTVDNGQGGGHQVVVTENPDQPGTYVMSDANGAYLPEGSPYTQPLTADQVVALMALGRDLGDSGGRSGNKGSGGQTANYG